MDDFEDAFENPDLNRLQLLLYLVPVFGLPVCLWNLSRRKSSRQTRAVSRLSTTLAIAWLLAYLLLNSGVHVAGEQSGAGISLLVLNSLLTSSYFLTSLWLMLRVWQKQSLNLPGLSRIAKHLP